MKTANRIPVLTGGVCTVIGAFGWVLSLWLGLWTFANDSLACAIAATAINIDQVPTRHRMNLGDTP